MENSPVCQLFQTVALLQKAFSEFLDSQLKPVMLSSRLHIKDSGDFFKKLKNIYAIPKDSAMVTADVMRLYPSILYEAGLKALEKSFNNLANEKVSTENLVRMSKFVLKSNYFKFNRNVKQQIL